MEEKVENDDVAGAVGELFQRTNALNFKMLGAQLLIARLLRRSLQVTVNPGDELDDLERLALQDVTALKSAADDAQNMAAREGAAAFIRETFSTTRRRL
jgi:hypothetical protein